MTSTPPTCSIEHNDLVCDLPAAHQTMNDPRHHDPVRGMWVTAVPGRRLGTLPPRPRPNVEAVDHPAHYNAHPSGIECIDVVEHMGFNVGNAVKYLWRADEKGAPIQDLEKARWYVDREIAKRKKEADGSAA